MVENINKAETIKRKERRSKKRVKGPKTRKEYERWILKRKFH